MTDTTIPVSYDTKEALASVKGADETWDEAMLRLAKQADNNSISGDDGSSNTIINGSEQSQLSEEHREILNAIERLPDRLRSELQ